MDTTRRGRWCLLPVLLLCLALLTPAWAQETTAGLQGTVKDPSGATIPKATVEVTSPALIGTKRAETDAAGYYRFANLPPGTYTVTVAAQGFRTVKNQNVVLEVGHLPNLDVTMQVGAVAETVEVSAQGALIDPTQSKVQTNIPDTNLMNLPTQSLSFQSVIQFAPGARTEPLQGGYQINGASNTENAYLVEGQETASMLTGASNTNVPMDFIQEVQVKTNGFEAEYGGALGGVVNVIQKSGSNELHGSVFAYYRADRFDAAPNPTQRLNPSFPTNLTGPRQDQPAQYYYPVKDHYRIADPGFSLGGPILKDRLWFFIGANPDFSTTRRTVNFSYNNVGARTFDQNINTYYTLARLDFLATSKIRMHGSWQYNYQRGTGTSLPNPDATNHILNTSASTNPDNFNGGIGYVQPNVLYNVGADITITPSLVATTRYGYWAYDGTPESRGLPTGIRFVYADTNYPYSTANIPNLSTTKSLNGQAIPTQFVNSPGFATIGANSATVFDWYRRHSFNTDFAWFKNFAGTHNFKFGYGFMHGTVDELTGAYNTAQVYVAYGVQYQPTGSTGRANCATIVAQNQSQFGAAGGNADGSACQGNYGTVNLRDLISAQGKVGGWNHSFYLQDAWTISRRLTLNVGLRLDKENLPSYNTLPGFQGISFGWGQKLAPRLGAAYDLLGNGKAKIFGSFGYFYDIMKYNLPQGSFGGAYWHDCVYALDTPDFNGIVPQRDAQGHYCPLSGPASGSVPNARFIENFDYREPANDPNQTGSLGKTGLVDPNLQPMKQHVWTFGGAFELWHDLVFEPLYTRTRLDRTIEDAGVITPEGEIYYIVNPGEGVNSQVPNCSSCPKNPKATRDYDGLELRLTKRFSKQWFGSVSYTYSRLYGNYTGLTATDVSDGGAARNGANTDRAFDEPFMQFDAGGKPINGPLPTDRPHAVKINAYYTPRWRGLQPTIGLFESVYSGTPLSSYMSVWGAPVFVADRGNFVPITTDNATGNWTAGSPVEVRTPHFAQTDISLFQDFHISKSNEKLIARVGGDCINCFNQHHVTLIQQNLLKTGQIQPFSCSGSACGSNVTDQNAGFIYSKVLGGYDYIGLANSTKNVLSGLYGQPYGWQAPRFVRFQVRFTF